MIGKLLASVVEAGLDVVDLSAALISDVIKSPVRLFEKIEPLGNSSEDFAEDTREVIEKIRERGE